MNISNQLKFTFAFVCAAIGTSFMTLPMLCAMFSIDGKFLMDASHISPWTILIMTLMMVVGWYWMGVIVGLTEYRPEEKKELPATLPPNVHPLFKARLKRLKK